MEEKSGLRELLPNAFNLSWSSWWKEKSKNDFTKTQGQEKSEKDDSNAKKKMVPPISAAPHSRHVTKIPRGLKPEKFGSSAIQGLFTSSTVHETNYNGSEETFSHKNHILEVSRGILHYFRGSRPSSTFKEESVKNQSRHKTNSPERYDCCSRNHREEKKLQHKPIRNKHNGSSDASTFEPKADTRGYTTETSVSAPEVLKDILLKTNAERNLHIKQFVNFGTEPPKTSTTQTSTCTSIDCGELCNCERLEFTRWPHSYMDEYGTDTSLCSTCLDVSNNQTIFPPKRLQAKQFQKRSSSSLSNAHVPELVQPTVELSKCKSIASFMDLDLKQSACALDQSACVMDENACTIDHSACAIGQSACSVDRSICNLDRSVCATNQSECVMDREERSTEQSPCLLEKNEYSMERCTICIPSSDSSSECTLEQIVSCQGSNDDEFSTVQEPKLTQ